MEGNFIFLISQPRSGSTLLQRILQKHSKISTIGEPWILLPILMEDFELKLKKGVPYNEFFANEAIKEFNNQLTNSKYLKKVAELKYYKDVCNKINENLKSSYFLDKTPRYYYIVDEIIKFFPDSKIIILTRHPLDVLNSIIQTWIRGSFGFMVNFTDDLFLAPKLLFNALGKDQVCHIKYEDIISSNDNVIKNLCAFLNIQFQEEMLNISNSNNWKFGDPNMNVKRKIEANNQNLWKKNMTAQKWRLFKEYIDSRSMHYFELFGYNIKQTQEVLMKNKPSFLSRTFTVGFNFLNSNLNRKIIFPIQFQIRRVNKYFKINN